MEFFLLYVRGPSVNAQSILEFILANGKAGGAAQVSDTCMLCSVGLNYDFTVFWSPNQQMGLDRE